MLLFMRRVSPSHTRDSGGKAGKAESNCGHGELHFEYVGNRFRLRLKWVYGEG